MSLSRLYTSRRGTLEDAVGQIENGQRVFVSGNGATPFAFLQALAERLRDLESLELVHVLLLGKDPLEDPAIRDRVFHRSLFVGPSDREAVNEGRGGYAPTHLHEMPRLFLEGHIPLDVAVIHTSPPDEHGFLSLGVEVLLSKAAVQSARKVIAIINEHMPRTHGDAFVHISQVDLFVEHHTELPELHRKPPTEVEFRIASYIAEMIEDGDTLQLGIGGIPDAVLQLLEGRRDLGIHTEMISDGIMEGVEKGMITGMRKTLHPGKVIGTFILGSRRLYRFVHDNPLFELHPADYTNDPYRIAQNDRMVAINSALEVDLTGQVCADSIGTYIYSGFGGQVDFIRGAARSRGGRPIIAMPSTARGGTLSRIVPVLKPGAGVVTTRADVHYVITEYGVAHLFGKTLQERARALIDIAHPDFREELTRAAWERKLLPRAFPGFSPPGERAS